MPPPVYWQPAGYYHFGSTADDYWGGTRPWNESATYECKDSRGKKRQEQNQRWDYDNWHESQPSEPGSFSWTDDEESWKQAEEERRRSEKEREERADAERRRRREKKRAERDKEQKRRNDAQIPEQQKKVLEKILALDEEIARLKATTRRSTLTGEAKEGFCTDVEGSDTVDHFSIKLNRRRRALSEAIGIHRSLCRLQRANGHDDEAENAEQELAKAREVSAAGLAHELARDDEDQSAGRASIHEERLPMQEPRHQSNQEKQRKLQEQYKWKNAPSGNRKPNGKRATVEHSDKEGTWSGEGNKHGLGLKFQEQADLGGNPDRMQLRHHRIYDWLDQLVENEEYEAPDGQTASNIEHPDSRTRPTQASRHAVDDQSETLTPDQSPCSPPSQGSHNIIDGEPKPLIPNLSPRSPPPQASHNFANGEPEPLIPHLNQTASVPLVSPPLVDLEPEPLIPGLTTDPSEPETEASMPNYLQTVHNHHLEVHGDFWDFVAGDEANCDFCGMVLPVLQCPNCDARACSECKTHRGGRSYPDTRGWR